MVDWRVCCCRFVWRGHFFDIRKCSLDPSLWLRFLICFRTNSAGCFIFWWCLGGWVGNRRAFGWITWASSDRSRLIRPNWRLGYWCWHLQYFSTLHDPWTLRPQVPSLSCASATGSLSSGSSSSRTPSPWVSLPTWAYVFLVSSSPRPPSACGWPRPALKSAPAWIVPWRISPGPPWF